VPEKKVFPPRTLLTLLGGIFALLIGSGWVIANDHWTRIDPQDPGKILVLNMVQSVRPQLDYFAQTRNSISEQAKKNLDRLRGESPSLERGSSD